MRSSQISNTIISVLFYKHTSVIYLCVRTSELLHADIQKNFIILFNHPHLLGFLCSLWTLTLFWSPSTCACLGGWASFFLRREAAGGEGCAFLSGPCASGRFWFYSGVHNFGVNRNGVQSWFPGARCFGVGGIALFLWLFHYSTRYVLSATFITELNLRDRTDVNN